MSRAEVKKGDRVTVYLGPVDKGRRERVIAFINHFGAGPFEVAGVGPTEVALSVPNQDRCRNIPQTCVARLR